MKEASPFKADSVAFSAMVHRVTPGVTNTTIHVQYMYNTRRTGREMGACHIFKTTGPILPKFTGYYKCINRMSRVT